MLRNGKELYSVEFRSIGFNPVLIDQDTQFRFQGDATVAEYDYAANLYKVRAPILVTVGPKDPFGSMAITKYAFDKVSSQDKELILLSKETGYSADYGHCDVILGKRSSEEVFPILLKWIEKRQ